MFQRKSQRGQTKIVQTSTEEASQIPHYKDAKVEED